MTLVEHNGVSAGTGRGVAAWQRIDLPEPYAGWWVEMRVNPSMRVWNDFSSGEGERFESALAALIRAWSVEDEDGHPAPLPADGYDWLDAPMDLQLVVVRAYQTAVLARVSIPKEISTPSAPVSSSGG